MHAPTRATGGAPRLLAAALAVVLLLVAAPAGAAPSEPAGPSDPAGQEDARGLVGGTADDTTTVSPQPMVVERLGGVGRVETAAVIAAALGRSGRSPAPSAVVARADDHADALAGVGLAHAVEGPLLLTGSAALDPPTAVALQEHVAPGATVHVLGGTAAVGAEVADAIDALGYVVDRHAGADRYATAAAVAGAQMEVLGKDGAATAVVASGTDFADALTASVPAARGGWPVLLTPPDALHPETARFLRAHGTHGIDVVGGERAVAAAVLDDMAGIAPVRRTAGADRYATAVAVAEQFLPASEDTGVALASGATYADALPGAVLAAARGVPLLLTGLRLPEVVGRYVGGVEPSAVTVLGGPAAVAPRAVDDAQRAVAAVRPGTVRWSPSPGDGLSTTTDAPPPSVTLTLPAATLTADSHAVLSRDSRPLQISVAVEGGTLVLTPSPEAIATLPIGRDVTTRLQAALLTDDGSSTYVDEDLVVRVDHPVVSTPEGFEALGGSDPVVGDAGTLRTYSLEVEPATGVDPRGFATLGTAILSDPRGWTAGGWRLQRVAPGDADVRVVLARPATVDALCARAGLRTGGIYSCWNNEFAAINLWRWDNGAAGFDGPLAAYRGYVLNHEVGHGLGYGHVGCPAAGAPAPVMMQQTKTTGACTANAWPFP